VSAGFGVIEDDGLAGRDRSSGLIEDEVGCIAGFQCCAHGPTVCTPLHHDPRAVRNFVVSERERIGTKREGRDHDGFDAVNFNSSVLEIYGSDKPTLTVKARSDSSTLTERDQLRRRHSTNDFLGYSVEDFGRGEFYALTKERFAPATGFNKADVLRIGFVPRAQIKPFGMLAHFLFVHSTNGQHKTLQNWTLDVTQDVTLILEGVDAPRQRWATIPQFHERVVPSGDGIKSKPLGPLKEEVKFDYPIAFNARVGCQSGGVIVDEGLNYCCFKLGRVVEDVVVNVK